MNAIQKHQRGMAPLVFLLVKEYTQGQRIIVGEIKTDKRKIEGTCMEQQGKR